MKKCIFIIVLIAALTAVACSENGSPPSTITVSGTVKSVDTNDVLASCTVTVGGRSVLTDAGGYFEIPLQTLSASDSIRVTKAGFAAYLKPLKNYASSPVVVHPLLNPVDLQVVADPAAHETAITTPDGASIKAMDGSLADLTRFSECMKTTL